MAQLAQTTERRSAGVAVLAISLLAVLALAGVGAAANLRAGARAERVRGLMPLAGALTTLVHELQRERSLSAGPAADAPALESARRRVDRAAAAYRAAAGVEVSDRDRQLDRRLDAGLAQLAGLRALRASVDAAGSGDPAATARQFRHYTAIVGGLLAVGGELGRLEAGQDAGLLRSVTAASVFSLAKEQADRERVAADQAAAGRTALDQAERIRLAALGGRQDALLDQFAALAGPEQLAWYTRAFPDAEVRRSVDLRRAALEGAPPPGPGPDLAAWSRSATARFERMREVELGLTTEVARQSALAHQAADRRALAYAATFLLAASALVVLLVLSASRSHSRRHTRDPAAGRSRRTRVPDPARVPAAPPARDPGTPESRLPLPSPPEGERSPPARGGVPAVHTPPGGHTLPGHTLPGHTLPGGYLPGGQTEPLVGGATHPATAPSEVAAGLAYLARRSQELVDQQLELLDRVGRDQADPRLPGRLLQLDRLAVRTRRNAHNLIVLAGGEPSRRWEGLAPMAEVAVAAVQDNPDAPRVDLDVADNLLVPGVAADDLANLLAELADNATAFSAPETRVRVGGQKVGSGYVLEVEDQGLGMTDGELDAVNRRLAGGAAGDHPEQRLGTWVAGRLAERHGVRVQLRRSPYGGVTALVFLPERLVVAAGEPGPGTHANHGGPGGEPADGDPAADALAGMPPRRYILQVPEDDRPLPKRAPHASLAPDLAVENPGDPALPSTARSPEQVRNMLTRYRSGLERGRAAAARDLPDDPDGDLSL